MFMFNIMRINCICRHNLTYFLYKNNLKLNLQCSMQTLANTQENKIIEDHKPDLLKLIEKYENSVLYNSVIEQHKLKLGFRKNKSVEQKILKEKIKTKFEIQNVEPLPVSLKYITDIKPQKSEEISEEVIIEENITHFPYQNVDRIESNTEQQEKKEISNSIAHEISVRQNWMTDYENFDDSETDDIENWKLEYGTPDPKSKVSNVPCGGCGALLHCKDAAIPGYIPSEIYKNHKYAEGQHLQSMVCQRCHFLKYYNMALQVRVSADEYPKILQKIKEHDKALVILMVDMLDFPCSIWPNILDIIGNKRPVVVVGNKVDLIPADSRGYLNQVKNVLIKSLIETGLSRANIKHVSLISAKTGYGIEELITKLHILWQYKGDVFLVGCTNVGKSSLFNALLQSDYCKIKAADLIQRATTSMWPGTTLNLLKFPILKPSGWRLYVRTKRLMSMNQIKSEEEKLRKIQLRNTNNPKYATLIGHIERTFESEEPITEPKDIFSVHGNQNASGRTKVGINEKSPEYMFSKWCYDTPGVVQPEQILHMLTTEELMLTLPKDLIRPLTFSVRPGNTIFIAGLGRLDFVEGSKSCRFTVFTSEHLPITICETKNADELYKQLLGTELLKVPLGNEDRLSKWPPLQSKNEIYLNGTGWEKSCADIVLSNAGWISVTCGNDLNCILKAWTPAMKGIYVREPILPQAVTLRGEKLRHSPAYKKSKFFVK